VATENLTLIERPCLEVPREISGETILAAGSLPLSSSIVVGMALRERPPMALVGYKETGGEVHRLLEIRKSCARRWTEFFLRHMASPADHAHESESIIRYILGMDIRTTHEPHLWQPIQYTDTEPRQPELDKGYSIMDQEEQPKHFVYGIDDPALCLSALGKYQPLIVAPINELMTHFNGDHLREIIPTGEATRYRF